jgi:pimeloyl-ACP methyl ester carboxylesterase
MLLTGHSLGGYVALAFLDLFPGRLAGYCLFHSHPFADTAIAIERRNREINVVNAGRKHLMYPGNIRKMYSPFNLDRMKEAIMRSDEIASVTPDDGIIAMLRGMVVRPSRKELLERGQVPLLWILGIHDQYIDYRTAVAAIDLPGNATLATLYESGHLGFVEEPERSLTLLTDFAFKVFGEYSRA